MRVVILCQGSIGDYTEIFFTKCLSQTQIISKVTVTVKGFCIISKDLYVTKFWKITHMGAFDM